jgi:hypothetical protein
LTRDAAGDDKSADESRRDKLYGYFDARHRLEQFTFHIELNGLQASAATDLQSVLDRWARGERVLDESSKLVLPWPEWFR